MPTGRGTPARGLRMTEGDGNTPEFVSQVRQIPACPQCGQDLYFDISGVKRNGTKTMELRCPRHGAFPRGWRHKFIADVKSIVKQQQGR